MTDDANCIIADSFYVDLLPIPTADFEVDSILKLNSLTTLLNNSTNEVSWDWDFGNQSYSIEESPSVIYDMEGDYTISLQVLNTEGCSDTISKSISVINSLVLYIPNTFTPNGDFKNDAFNVSVLNYTEFEISIHNYYGTKLFSTTDPSIGWDGTYKGRSVQEGTYVVSIFAIDVFGRVYKRNKNLILLK